MFDLTELGFSAGPSGELAGYAAGQVLVERYQLERVIGRGGTALVWVARDSVLDIEVAVKVVLPSSDDITGELKQRTVQEARLCAQLTDPAVCRVLDFGFTHRGDPFVVSELLEGETLDDRLTRENRLGEVDAVRLLLPILDALGAAHRKGIVHRDVKPANVFLAEADGRIQPKLLDFGIACCLSAASRMTTTGLVCGTPCYMSPEQARGSGDIDLRSDLWSFSVMLYEMVSGTAPFLGENYHATLFAIASDTAPPLSSLGFDERLARIVERGMAKEREQRWSSAAELADALSRWLVDRGFESDVYGLSLQRRFLEMPVSAELGEDVSSARGVSFSLGQRGRAGARRSGSKGLIAGGVVALGAVAALAGVRLVWTDDARPENVAPAPARVAPDLPAAIARADVAPVPLPAPARAELPRIQPVGAALVQDERQPSSRAVPKTSPATSASVQQAPPPEPVASPPELLPLTPLPKPAQKPRATPRNALRYDFGI